MDTTSIYEGFLSYAHVDEAIAAKLHRALESYKIPKGVTGKLSPIFRDTDELTAHHSLSEKIKGAVTGSKVLIVLCSPAAKASHWVNEEIRLFRKIHGEASILCVLAEGTPETSFPPALLADGREPLAANLGGSKDSFRLGVSQIAAAMLGVGLDTLIQRETRRKRRRLQSVTAGALVFSGLMGATTFTAVTAQKAAETNRMQAEGLVEYMITDLKEKLEPVGRLDILDSIGDRAVEYYDAQNIEKLSDDSLARQARARHILGKVALDAGDFDKARQEIEAAARVTKEIYDRNPEDTDAIFNHAQSEYWVGLTYYKLNDIPKAYPHWQNYAEFGELLHASDPKNYDWIMERGWGANNLALLANREGNFELAQRKYLEAIDFFKVASVLSKNNFETQKQIANSLGGLAQVTLQSGDKKQAFEHREQQRQTYKKLMERRPNDYFLRNIYAHALSRSVTEGYFDNNSEKLRSEVVITCNEFEHLISHDPENLSWRNDYYFALKAMLNHINSHNLDDVDTTYIQRRIKKLKAF